jgi:hypothetical protein
MPTLTLRPNAPGSSTQCDVVGAAHFYVEVDYTEVTHVNSCEVPREGWRPWRRIVV